MKTKPPALSTLRRKASATANAFGHRLKWSEPHGRPPVPHLGEPYESYAQIGTCRCGASVRIAQFGVHAVQGSAVSAPCHKARLNPGNLSAVLL